jgi:two-component system, OmpR family, phosphate regulon sensor histidine kinase PhoR
MSARRSSTQSVSRRLTGTFVLFVVLLGVVAGSGALGLLLVGHSRSAELRLNRLRVANTAMLLSMADAETGVRGYGLAQQRVFLEPYEQGRLAFRTHAAEALRAAHEDETALVQQQVTLADRWFAVYADPVAEMRPGQVVVSAQLGLANKHTFDELRAVNARLDQVVRVQDRAALRREAQVRLGSLTVTTLALLVALVLAVLTDRRTRDILEEPLLAVVRVLGALTAGDHAVRADVDDGPPEVRAVARSVNELSDRSDLLREEQSELSRLQRLATELGRGVREHLVADESVQAAVSCLGRALSADRVYVRLLEDDGVGSVRHEWQRPGLAPTQGAAAAPQGGSMSRWVRALCAQDEPQSFPDLLAVRGVDPEVDAFAGRSRASAALALPLGTADHPLGMLCLVMEDAPRSWLDREVALCRSAAADLGRALTMATLYAQQEQLVAQLRRLDRTKTDFLSTVSHELRTPLTSIAGYVEMLRDGDAGPVPPAMDAMLTVVDRNTVRLRTLIEDLLSLSQIEAGAPRTRSADVRLSDVVTGSASALRPAAESAGLTLDVGPVPDDVVVVGDRDQLERVVANLLSNAVKFTPAGGTVQVDVRAADGWATVSVVDSGIGIPAAEQDAMSSRFFRATNATDRAIPGTGLGLTLARSIVDHHGGVLSIRSVEHQGTTVEVRLPLSPTHSLPAGVPLEVGA